MDSRDVVLDDEELLLLNEVLSSRFGLHFPPHKKDLLASRLRPRLVARHLRSFFDYYLAVRYDRNGELERFAEVVTNHETYFFREDHQFKAFFAGGLHPPVVGPGFGPGSRRIRVLSAGCSSGEEAYSLNIHAQAYGFTGGDRRVEIDAFDLDRRHIETARRAVYGSHALRGVSEDDVRCYFRRRTEDRFDLRAPYRRGVRFRAGNIMDLSTFPSRGPYDAVFCRNVFIYFTEAAMLRSLENFAQVLRPGGLLFLGHSESAIGISPHFESVRLDRSLAYRRVCP
jgi:chemotaxis protein methyltransferase CheR